MNKIYVRSFDEQFNGKDWRETKHGSLDRDDAISQMILLCAQTISALQKTGKRATLDSGIWDGRLVVRVINNSKIVESYSILK